MKPIPLTYAQKRHRRIARAFGTMTIKSIRHALHPVYEDDPATYTDQAARYAREAWRSALLGERSTAEQRQDR